MRAVLVFMLVVLLVHGNLLRKCIRTKGRMLECKDTRGNLTCGDITDEMKNVEVLVFRRVYVSGLDITPVCLPQLKKIIVERARHLVCKGLIFGRLKRKMKRPLQPPLEPPSFPFQATRIISTLKKVCYT